jgi:hypothetical protein
LHHLLPDTATDKDSFINWHLHVLAGRSHPQTLLAANFGYANVLTSADIIQSFQFKAAKFGDLAEKSI